MFISEIEFLKHSKSLGFNLQKTDYQNYLNNYYLFFARYMVLLCENDYNKYNQVAELSYEKAIQILKEGNCKKNISKILICEAPPLSPLNYFYNPSSLWNSSKGRPGLGQAYTTSIFDALFSGLSFSTKQEFLEECAKSGFLLLDLFPFAVTFSKVRKKSVYSKQCVLHFTARIIQFLQDHQGCIMNQESIGFAFGLKNMGEVILSDTTCIKNFNNWQLSNNVTLDPQLPIDAHRGIKVINSSDFLRVCLKRYSLFPNAALLNIAGIR